MATALLSLSRLAAPNETAEGTRIMDAREALDYWSSHASGLPWHRRAARREARVMIARFRAELIAAHLERWGLGAVARVLAPLLDTRGRGAGAHLRTLALTSMRRNALGRRILIGAASIAAVSLACVALIAALATHLVAL
jgi:hypothetical protein